MQCPKCQFENPEKMQFCGRCGSKLQNLCPFCEFANPPDFQFCGKCGAKLTQEEALSNIAVPKLEDMQAQLQGLIPTHLIKSMKLAEQKIVGENRLVTTLFADLSGFTPMSQELPTEVVVEKVNQCFQAITTAVYRYEGNINRFIGDETLAFFGAPLAHENDPERAVLAALDMRRAVSQLGLKISIGINTGMMYFGPIGTPQQHVEISAYGPDINLAKRLQQEAQPGQILVGEGTYRPTRRAFEFESLPPQELRGIAEPVTAYSVLKALPKPEKMRGIEGLKAEMIGREKEFADLKGRLDELLAGRGQIVSIIGEAGLGKSRLATELKEYIKDKEKAGGKTVCRILEGRCVSIGEPIGYSVFTDILRNYFQFSQEESEKERGRKIVDKMKVLFPQKPDSSTSSGQEGSEGWADIVPYIGNLLSVKFGNEWDEKVKHLPPEQVKYQICLKLRDLFLALANRKPLLFILDDLHWADNLSLDLLSLLMDELRYAPLMLLCIYRPDKEHKSWHIGAIAGGKCLDRYSEIRLQELNPPESRLLVESLLRVENLPEKIKASILDKAGGNPFFVEEVIRSLIYRGFIYRDGAKWIAKTDIEEISVPDTIQSVIMARIDSLPDEVRYVLQCASVIGKLFQRKLLQTTQAVHEVTAVRRSRPLVSIRKPWVECEAYRNLLNPRLFAERSEREQNLDRYLWQLQDKELIYEERAIPELEYSFRHALIQETVYQNLLSRHRQALHQKVADEIEGLYQDRIDQFYEELAWHYSQSGDIPKAIDYLLKAGEKAKKMYANQEAIRYFERALEFLQSQPSDEKRMSLEMTASELLGDVLFTTGAHHDAEVQFNNALDLASRQGDTRHIAALTCKQADIIHLQDYNQAIEMAEAALAALGEQIYCPEAANLLEVITRSYWGKGDLETARRYANRNAQIIRQIEYFDSLYKIYYSLAWLEIKALGNFKAANNWLEEMERVCLENDDEVGLARCYHGLGDLYAWYQNDFRQASQWLERSLNYCKRTGEAHYLLEGHLELAHHLILLDDNPASIEQHIQSGMQIAKQMVGTSKVAPVPGLCTILADAYLEKGNIEQALIYFQHAIEFGPSTYILTFLLRRLEQFYTSKNQQQLFFALCQRIQQQIAPQAKTTLRYWHLRPGLPPDDYFQLTWYDLFESASPREEWQWVDPQGDSSYHLDSEQGILELRTSAHDAYHPNLGIPRLVRKISGDFAIQTRLVDITEGKCQTGGLIIWASENGYINLGKVIYLSYGTVPTLINDLNLGVCQQGQYEIIGRGWLEGKQLYLRLERHGESVAAFCSDDGQQWYRCGEATLALEDCLWIGLYVSCPSRLTDSAVRFKEFKLFQREVL